MTLSKMQTNILILFRFGNTPSEIQPTKSSSSPNDALSTFV